VRPAYYWVDIVIDIDADTAERHDAIVEAALHVNPIRIIYKFRRTEKIFGLAELLRKVKNTANIRLSAGVFGLDKLSQNRTVSNSAGKKATVKVVNLYSALRVHASNALSSLTRAACRTATVCSLQTQTGAAAG